MTEDAAGERSDRRPGGMPPGEFRRWGHRFVDWIGDYLETVESRPVLSAVEPGDVAAGLASEAPVEGEGFEALLRDLDSVVMPGITHWNHPSFFSYFAVSGSGPGILGEFVAAALNVNAMVWASSPAATELEERTTDWLRRFLGLPAEFLGTVHDTASTSTFLALVAARERGLPEARDAGLASAPPGRVYTTREAHSSVFKAVRAAGLGRGGATLVDSPGRARAMDPRDLARAIDRDAAAGARPLAVVATIGSTSTNAVDPVAEIADVAAARDVWLHVDAAYAGPAAALAEARPRFRGWERADSIVVNPHKWLATPVDCSVLYVRDPATLAAAFSLVPAYLETSGRRGTDLMDRGLALGRRFRALKLWFVMRYFGQDGLRAMIARHVDLAGELAEWVDAAEDWERWRPRPFSLVVLRWAPAGQAAAARDEANRRILDLVNRGGSAFLSRTEIDGEVWIRVAIGNVHTERRHVRSAWRALVEAAGRVSGRRKDGSASDPLALTPRESP